MQLKEDRKGKQKKVLETAKEGNINMFIVIKSHGNRHVIIDERSEILGYRYHIKLEPLGILEETTVDLRHTGVNTGK